MAILLLLISFIAVFFAICILINQKSKKEYLLYTVLIFSGIIVLMTELLSCFFSLNFKNIFISWLCVLILIIIFLYQKKHHFKILLSRLKYEIKEVCLNINNTIFYDRCLLFSVLIILLLIFVQGIIYPPNNWDSMNYHLARIPSWISHQTVAHYPTSFPPQVYQPPFAEFVAMHFNILNKADYFSSTVQFLFLVFSIIAFIAIIEKFGLNFSYKILVVFLALTIPEVILQATSTQNDVVIAFFVVTAFYFAIKSIEKTSLKNAFFFGLAVGLGILTKATAYIYMPAILLIYGGTLIFRIVITKNYKYLLYAVLAGSMFLLVNFGFYSRNYKLTNSFLGVDSKEYGTYSNEKMSTKLMLSSMIKNAGVHIGLYHLKPLSILSANIIIRLHKMMGVDIDDPANNFFTDKYSTLYNPDHEDAAPNFIHLILTITSLIIIFIKSFKRPINFYVKLLAFTIIFQALFFCIYLKYQPFHTRLHTSMFLLSIPLISYTISLIDLNLKKVFYWSTPLIFAYAFIIVLGNLNTPYNSKIMQNRYQKYFISKPFLYQEYKDINNTINTNSYKNIGLIMGTESWDYSFFTDCYSKDINPVYINVKNYTKKANPFNTKIDCIVSTEGNFPYIDYLGKRFYNQNLTYKFIHLYE